MQLYLSPSFSFVLIYIFSSSISQESQRQSGERELGCYCPSRAGANTTAGKRAPEVQPGVWDPSPTVPQVEHRLYEASFAVYFLIFITLWGARGCEFNQKWKIKVHTVLVCWFALCSYYQYITVLQTNPTHWIANSSDFAGTKRVGYEFYVISLFGQKQRWGLQRSLCLKSKCEQGESEHQVAYSFSLWYFPLALRDTTLINVYVNDSFTSFLFNLCL